MKTAKKIICMLLVLTTVFGLVTVPAFAASGSAYTVLSSSNYAKTYTLATSGITIPYTTSQLNKRGSVTYGESGGAYIDNSTDELYVKSVGETSGTWWAFVSYPISGGRRSEAYIPLSAISVNSGDHVSRTSTGKFYCSPRENGALSSSYYVAKGDQVFLLGIYDGGNKYQIMYPTSGGKWRIAFCRASDYHTYVSSDVKRVSEGTYVILSALNSNKAVDVNGASTASGANVQLWSRNDSGAQIFRISYAGGGYYFIQNTNSGMYLDVCGAVAKTGTNVQQYLGNNSVAQRWCFEDAGNGYFYIRSELGLYLDVSNALTADGTNIHIWTGNKTNAQRFKLVPNNTGSTFSPKVSLNVPYFMQTDQRWSDVYIGTKTIGQVGCLITAAAMVHSYRTGSTISPKAMKDKLTFVNNSLVWSSLAGLGYTHSTPSGSIDNMLMTSIYQQLKAGKPVILGAYNSSSSHWIVITGYTGSSTSTFEASDFTINDPNNASRTNLAQFLSAFPTLEGMVY